MRGVSLRIPEYSWLPRDARVWAVAGWGTPFPYIRIQLYGALVWVSVAAGFVGWRWGLLMSAVVGVTALAAWPLRRRYSTRMHGQWIGFDRDAVRVISAPASEAPAVEFTMSARGAALLGKEESAACFEAARGIVRAYTAERWRRVPLGGPDAEVDHWRMEWDSPLLHLFAGAADPLLLVVRDAAGACVLRVDRPKARRPARAAVRRPRTERWWTTAARALWRRWKERARRRKGDLRDHQVRMLHEIGAVLRTPVPGVGASEVRVPRELRVPASDLRTICALGAVPARLLEAEFDDPRQVSEAPVDVGLDLGAVRAWPSRLDEVPLAQLAKADRSWVAGVLRDDLRAEMFRERRLDTVDPEHLRAWHRRWRMIVTRYEVRRHTPGARRSRAVSAGRQKFDLLPVHRTLSETGATALKLVITATDVFHDPLRAALAEPLDLSAAPSARRLPWPRGVTAARVANAVLLWVPLLVMLGSRLSR
ncbi:hypothetical protein AB0M28_31545 [Streptomyces sp. NPDC051940]|uniref:hypothetical protein n=1 Tax=Streptomyces sp. NPDC051940 TaxID=3155675 RepID=UPI003429B8EB